MSFLDMTDRALSKKIKKAKDNYQLIQSMPFKVDTIYWDVLTNNITALEEYQSYLKNVNSIIENDMATLEETDRLIEQQNIKKDEFEKKISQFGGTNLENDIKVLEKSINRNLQYRNDLENIVHINNSKTTELLNEKLDKKFVNPQILEDIINDDYIKLTEKEELASLANLNPKPLEERIEATKGAYEKLKVDLDKVDKFKELYENDGNSMIESRYAHPEEAGDCYHVMNKYNREIQLVQTVASKLFEKQQLLERAKNEQENQVIKIEDNYQHDNFGDWSMLPQKLEEKPQKPEEESQKLEEGPQKPEEKPKKPEENNNKKKKQSKSKKNKDDTVGKVVKEVLVESFEQIKNTWLIKGTNKMKTSIIAFIDKKSFKMSEEDINRIRNARGRYYGYSGVFDRNSEIEGKSIK